MPLHRRGLGLELGAPEMGGVDSIPGLAEIHEADTAAGDYTLSASDIAAVPIAPSEKVGVLVAVVVVR